MKGHFMQHKSVFSAFFRGIEVRAGALDLSASPRYAVAGKSKGRLHGEHLPAGGIQKSPRVCEVMQRLPVARRRAIMGRPAVGGPIPVFFLEASPDMRRFSIESHAMSRAAPPGLLRVCAARFGRRATGTGPGGAAA